MQKGVVKKRRRSGLAVQARHVGAIASRKPEVKNNDTDSGGVVVSANTWKFFLLNGIAGGTTRTTRIGGSINITKVQANIVAAPQAAGYALGETRFVLIYDHNPQGAIPAATDIFSSDSFGAFMNISNSDRFMVLADEYIVEKNGTNIYTSVAGGLQSLHLSLFRKMPAPGILQKFLNTNGGTIADITSGAIYLGFVTAPGPVATQAQIQYQTRVRFTDA